MLLWQVIVSMRDRELEKNSIHFGFKWIMKVYETWGKRCTYIRFKFALNTSEEKCGICRDMMYSRYWEILVLKALITRFLTTQEDDKIPTYVVEKRETYRSIWGKTKVGFRKVQHVIYINKVTVRLSVLLFSRFMDLNASVTQIFCELPMNM